MGSVTMSSTWLDFLVGMSGDPSPQTVSYEYLELVQLSEKYKEESIFAQEDVVDDNDTSTMTTMITFLLSPLDFVMKLIDGWMEQKVKRILMKTSHLRKRYYK